MFLLGVHAMPYGSPVKPGRHLHIPLWFLGVQSAFWAQSQGSTHFSFLHVKVVEQSGSVKHSGRLHLSYGLPIWSGKQVHFGRWFLTPHSALIPQRSKGQGSWHSLSIQACVNGHSESLLHPAKEEKWCPLLALSFQTSNTIYWKCMLESILRSSQNV